MVKFALNLHLKSAVKAFKLSGLEIPFLWMKYVQNLQKQYSGASTSTIQANGELEGPGSRS